MSSEQLLFSAVGVLTTWLGVVVTELWRRSNQCEKDRVELRKRVEKLENMHGMAKGELKAYEKCPADGCPFRDDCPSPV